MSRSCTVVDSIDCEAPVDAPGAGSVVTCWAREVAYRVLFLAVRGATS